MSHRRSQISGQFAARLIELLESPPYRVLSLAAHRVLDRIEIEMAHHGGWKENGKLPVTYDDFEAYGIDRKAIPPAIRELVALGFIEITEQGRAGNGEHRKANLFRLTFHATKGLLGDGTHEWRKAASDLAEAEEIAKQARQAKPKKHFTRVGKHPETRGGKHPWKRKTPGGESTPTAIVGKPPLHSISRVGAGTSSGAEPPPKAAAPPQGRSNPPSLAIRNGAAVVEAAVAKNGAVFPPEVEVEPAASIDDDGWGPPIVDQVEVAAPGGGTTIYLNADDVRRYREDPDGVAGMRLGLTREEYREWVALDGAPLCGCMTRAGKPCCTSVGRVQLSAEAWKQDHRRITCAAHKGQPLQCDNISDGWVAALDEDRAKAIADHKRWKEERAA